MVVCNVLICPNCGGKLKYYDSVKRMIKTRRGVKDYIKIRRLKCRRCERIHRELPRNVKPYKHYESDIIEGVQEGFITPDTIGFEDYPCETTMYRWRHFEKGVNSIMKLNRFIGEKKYPSKGSK